MNKITLLDDDRVRLQPYLKRNVAGLGRLDADTLVEKINALPDTTREKALLTHYWQRLCLALGQDNAEAVAGWLVALALATHTAGFLLQKARGKVKQEKKMKLVQADGTAANAKSSADKQLTLKTAVEEYCAPLKQSTWSPSGCLTWIKQRETYYQGGKYCGYARSTAERYIRTILEKRKSH